jgi:hypothetical protein
MPPRDPPAPGQLTGRQPWVGRLVAVLVTPSQRSARPRRLRAGSRSSLSSRAMGAGEPGAAWSCNRRMGESSRFAASCCSPATLPTNSRPTASPVQGWRAGGPRLQRLNPSWM